MNLVWWKVGYSVQGMCRRSGLEVSSCVSEKEEDWFGEMGVFPFLPRSVVDYRYGGQKLEW